MTSSCRRSTTSCSRHSFPWYCPVHPVPEPVCEMQIPSLFTMARSSPQPQSVDTITYAQVYPLPSPATSSSSSGELHLYIESDTRTPSIPVRPLSSSQELLLKGDQLVSQPPPVFATTTYTSIPTSQPPPQPTSISSWADEVTRTEQSGRSTTETIFLIWAYSGRIRGPRPRSQPRVYPQPVKPTLF